MLILTVSWLWSTVLAVMVDILSLKVGGYALCTPVSLNNFTFTVRSPNDNRINLCAQLVSLHLHPQAEKYFDTSYTVNTGYMLHVGCPLGFYPVNIQKGVLFILFPFFKRFKNFFTLTYYANRMKQYRLAYRAKVIQRHDFIEGTFSVVRLNLKKGA